VRRRAIRAATIMALVIPLLPVLAVAAPGQRPAGSGSRGAVSHGVGGHRWHNRAGHGHRGGHGHQGGHGHGFRHGHHGGHGHWHGSRWCCAGFGWGFGAGVFATSPWWAYSPVYAVPAYPAYPAYPVYPAYPAAYPAYGYPAPPAPPAPPPAPGAPAAPDVPGSTTPTPEPLSSRPAPPPASSVGSAPPGSGAGCETVTVAGHWEMRVFSDGQRSTVWVPTTTRSVCR
jgi:hypothetical protein